jgi:hypothetical protein
MLLHGNAVGGLNRIQDSAYCSKSLIKRDPFVRGERSGDPLDGAAVKNARN